MTRSEPGTHKVYAAFRIRGDNLDPDRITRILRVIPTVAYAKGDKYFAGPRTGELVGRTGVWLLSTEKLVASDNLHHHLYYILGVLVPGRQDPIPLAQLHAVLSRTKGLRADLSCFWHGRHGAKKPSIPRLVTEVMKLVPADIESEFATDSDGVSHRGVI